MHTDLPDYTALSLYLYTAPLSNVCLCYPKLSSATLNSIILSSDRPNFYVDAIHGSKVNFVVDQDGHSYLIFMDV